MPKQVSSHFEKSLRWIPIALINFVSSFQVFANPIDIAVLTTSSDHRALFVKYEKDFEQNNPDININIKFLSDTDFKQSLSQWLKEKSGPQIVTWQAGQRLFQLVDKNQVTDLSFIWNKYGLHDKFSVSATHAITRDNSQYAIPASYYQWGLYYRHSLFQQLNLSPPNTWEQLVSICETLLKNDVVPFTIGAKNKWTSAAWFDYLNLRINGLEFHQKLLLGEHSFQSSEVREVFERWRELLDKGCFTDRFKGWNWSEAMPFLYHKLAGMTLIGNFFASNLPTTLEEDFRFSAFPEINSGVPLYEEAPLDLFMVPSYAQMDEALEKVIVSLTDEQFLGKLNEATTMISPIRGSKPMNKNYFITEGQNLLSKAEGVSQFFDRDTNADMANSATTIFTDFMADKNVEQALNKLEDARKKHLLSKLTH
ncbi:ABC transporter substrate-binding protein [Agaribacter flavus]|uniref:ABC transporter substrate-binding protein n=1 Tax=Agaribacter flavus TaxID=1902781 RepID=A0ABV7FYC9_9ALTE